MSSNTIDEELFFEIITHIFPLGAKSLTFAKALIQAKILIIHSVHFEPGSVKMQDKRSGDLKPSEKRSSRF